MSKKRQIQKDNPDVNVSALDLAEQFDTNHDLKALADTQGGKQLVQLLLRDVVSTVNRLAAGRTSYTLPEFQAAGSDIDTKLNLLRVIVRAEDNEKLLEEMIADALAE